MRYLILLSLFCLFWVGCSEKNEIIRQDSEVENEVDPFPNLLTEEEWKSTLLEIIDKGYKSSGLVSIYGRNTLQEPLDIAAIALGFTWKGGLSIKDHKGFKTVGGLSFYEFDGHYLFIYKISIGRIDLYPVWGIADILIVPGSNPSFSISEAKTDDMDRFNRENNIWGIFDWDSPLIKPDVYIPADKVIIIDIDTSTMTVEDNEDGEYKVFIDAAFLE